MTQSIWLVLSGLLFCRIATRCPVMLNLHSQSWSCRHSRSDGGSIRVVGRQTQLRQNIELLLQLQKAVDQQRLAGFHPRKLVNACFGAQNVALRTIMIFNPDGTSWRIKTSCPIKDS